MFPSLDNNGYNLFDPFNFDQTTTTMQNPISDHHQQYSPFTPYFEAFVGNGNDDDDSLMLFQQQDIFGSCSNTIASPRNGAKKATSDDDGNKKKQKKKGKVDGGTDEGGATAKEAVPHRRSGRKDRHSKIFTAKGPRDRRMRLSLQIAREFFDLQDMLGFEKASKTIEWLISESRASIEELKESIAASSGGDYELEEHGQNIGQGIGETQEGTTGIRRRRRRAIKIGHELRTTKESRNEARKRARERTINKRLGSVVGILPRTFCDRQETNSNDLDQLGSSQETCREDLGSCSQETRLNVGEEEQEQGLSNVHLMLEINQMDSVRIIEKFLGISSDSSSSSISGDSVPGVNSEESYYSGLPGTGASESVMELSLQQWRSTSSSTMIKKHNTTSSSASINHSSKSLMSIFDYLG